MFNRNKVAKPPSKEKQTIVLRAEESFRINQGDIIIIPCQIPMHNQASKQIPETCLMSFIVLLVTVYEVDEALAYAQLIPHFI